MDNIVVTKREILITIIISCILIGIGILISSSIKSNVYEDNECYYKSLKIDNDENMYQYALRTNVGYTLVSGKIKAVNPVSSERIDGQYYYIREEKERYTEHSRRVSHTKTVPDGKGGVKTETYYTTEYYWTWDNIDTNTYHTDMFNFLGTNYNYDKIRFSKEVYKDTVKESSKIRYVYYVTPIEFDVTLFTFITDNDITDVHVYYSKIPEIIENKQKAGTGAVVGFWIAWVFIIALIDFVYVSLENKYLEG